MRQVLALNVPIRLRAAQGGDVGVLSRGDPARQRAARSGTRRGRHGGAVARRQHVRPRLPVHRRGLQQGERRGGSARPLPLRLAWLLWRARRADHRRARLQRGRSRRQRVGGDHQPERCAAHVHVGRSPQPAPVVDRSGDGLHRPPHRTPPHHRRGRRRGRRERGAGPGDDGLSPARAGVRRRPAVRPHEGRPLHAGSAGHQADPRSRARPAGRTRRDARRRPGRGAGAEPTQRAGVRRLRRRRADDRGRRRGRRAGLLGERADARVRRAAGDRLRASPPAGAGAPRRCRHRRHRRRRRGRRAGPGVARGPLPVR